VIESGASLWTVFERLYLGWGVTIPGGQCGGVAAGGHIQGGGYGALSRRLGSVVDYLYAVEIVVVDRSGRARAVVATREPGDENRDLWWAHTGGGGGNPDPPTVARPDYRRAGRDRFRDLRMGERLAFRAFERCRPLLRDVR
jgi:hypothetical protein